MELQKITPETREQMFSEAYNGSYYTITGCGGPLEEWTDGYTELLTNEQIGKPEKFITFKGIDMNEHYGLTGTNAYPEDVTFLMFPIDGMVIPKLAIFKMRMADRWFDDIVDNNNRREYQEETI